MGIFFRKSFRFGSRRLNLSTGGFGISDGIKGLRLGVGRRGAYLSAGMKGLYYRKGLGQIAGANVASSGGERFMLGCLALAGFAIVAWVVMIVRWLF